MAVSIVTYTGDGSTSQYIITFDYIDRTHVSATVGGTAASFTFINDTTIQFNTAPASAAEVKLVRQTPVAALVDFTDGSTLFEADLDLAHRQNRLLAEESRDRADNAITTLNNNITNINTAAASDVAINTVAAGIANVNNVATNMAEVLLADTNAATATTKASEASASAATASQQATISTTKAGEASGSAAAALVSKNAASGSAGEALASKNEATTQAGLATTNGAAQVSLAAGQVALATTQVGLATTKAGEASTSASTATTQANTATTQAGISTTKAGEAAASAASITGAETNSAASASAAAGSASSAANSAASAATALDNFEDKYLGSLSSEPTVDLDGNALVSGALYFSQTSSSMQVYDGANWIAASSAGVASLNLFEYTATAGQTTFTGNDDNGAAMSYIVGNNIVALNGVILDPSDFSDASGLSIVLTAGATVGDLLNVYAFKSFTVADTVSKTSGGTFNADVTVLGTLAATTVTGDGSALTGLPAGYTDADVASYLAGVGNVVVGGTVDGRDVAADGATLDGLGTAASSAATDFVAVTGDSMTGNLLLGKTTLEYDNTAGHIFRSDGLQSSIRDGGNVADFNRLSSAGEIIRLSNGGSTVGSLGNRGDSLFVESSASNRTGLDFSGAILPRYAGSLNSGNNVDIGASSYKFKDAHFSGTVAATSYTGDGSGLTGVGGAWTLISETPITSSVHYIDVTFPAGYVEYIVEFPRLYGASTSQFTPIIRVLDTSGNPVTTYHGYRTAQSSIANTQSNTYHPMGASFYSGSANTAAMRLHFFNQPRSSNTRTMANTYSNAGPAGEMENGRFAMKDHFAVGGMRLYSQWGTSSGPITSASHDYKIWGLK